MKVEIVTITPDVAHELLGKNTHNRSVRPLMVAQYAADMKAGNWPTTGDAIKVGTNDVVLDGQHRLMACVEADTAFTTLIAWDVEPDAQRFMDKGAKRKFSDTLKLAGVPNNILMAAATQGVCAAETLDSLRNLRGTRASDAMLWDTWEKHHDEMQAFANIYSKMSNELEVPAGATAALLHRFLQLDPADAQGFFARLVDDAGHEKGQPIYQLRKQLMQSHMSLTKLTPQMKTALIIKAWNKWRAGDTCSLLTWKAGGATPEKFPEAK